MEKISKWFIEKTTFKKSNLLTVPGASLLLVSLALPWFRQVYPASTHTLSPSEIVAGFFIFDNGAPGLLIFSFLYLASLAFLAFLIPKRLSAYLAAGGIIITTLALYSNYVSFERFLWGMAVSFAGLLLLLSGFIDEQR